MSCTLAGTLIKNVLKNPLNRLIANLKSIYGGAHKHGQFVGTFYRVELIHSRVLRPSNIYIYVIKSLIYTSTNEMTKLIDLRYLK